MLGNKVDLQSDGEDGSDDDACFVPTKIDLQSSSDEEEEAKIDSEDELVVKKRRGSRTPRSTEKTRVSARTPRKTPSKKVKSIFLLCLVFLLADNVPSQNPPAFYIKITLHFANNLSFI